MSENIYKDEVPVTTSLPSQAGHTGQFLKTNGATVDWDVAGGGAGTPGGSDKQIQFNDATAFGGAANIEWDKTGKTFDFLDKAQLLRMWNATGTDYERAYMKWDTNIFKIGVEKGGSGTQRVMWLTNATTQMSFGSTDNSAQAVPFWFGHTGSSVGALVIGDSATVTNYTGILLRSTTTSQLGFSAGGVLAIGTGTSDYTKHLVINASGDLLRYNLISSVPSSIGSDWERAYIKWDSNTFKIGVEKGGSGVKRAMVIDADAINATALVQITGTGTPLAGAGKVGLELKYAAGSIIQSVDRTGSAAYTALAIEGLPTSINQNSLNQLAIYGGIQYPSIQTLANTGNINLVSRLTLFNASTTTFTATLPTAVGCAGQEKVLKNVGAAIVTISGAVNIDSLITQTLSQYDSITVLSDGTQWWVI
jgi:hypothetical protein